MKGLKQELVIGKRTSNAKDNFFLPFKLKILWLYTKQWSVKLKEKLIFCFHKNAGSVNNVNTGDLFKIQYKNELMQKKRLGFFYEKLIF